MPWPYLTQRRPGSGVRTGTQVCRPTGRQQLLPAQVLTPLATAENSWPTFCKCLLSYARNTTKAQVDLGLTKTLRKLVQVAEEPRPGKQCLRAHSAAPLHDRALSGAGGEGKQCTLPLLRIAARLFDYIASSLELSAMPDVVRQELGLLLRQHLLPVQEYCQEVPESVFESVHPYTSVPEAV